MSDDVERRAVERRSNVDRESAADGAPPRRGDRRRRGGSGSVAVGTSTTAAADAAVPHQGAVDRGAGGDVRHVEGPREGVDGGASRLVGEAEQREYTVRDGRAYCTRKQHTRTQQLYLRQYDST